MNIKDTTRQSAAVGLASTIVAVGTLFFPTAAVADQNSGECGRPAATRTTAVNIDDHVFLRKAAMTQGAVG